MHVINGTMVNVIYFIDHPRCRLGAPPRPPTLGSAAEWRCMPRAPESEATVVLPSRRVGSLAVSDRPENRVGYPASCSGAAEWPQEAKSMLLCSVSVSRLPANRMEVGLTLATLSRWVASGEPAEWTSDRRAPDEAVGELTAQTCISTVTSDGCITCPSPCRCSCRSYGGLTSSPRV